MSNPDLNRKSKPWVAVAGPWSQPDPCFNVHRITQLVDEIWSDGICFPICPMIESHLMQSICPHTYEKNLERCMEMMVGSCDAYIYLPGSSSGVREEIRAMLRHGIPVFSDKESLYAAVLDGTIKKPLSA